MKDKRFNTSSYKLDFSYLISKKFVELELNKSLVAGEGILTKEEIKKGQIICPLCGMIYRMSEAKIDFPKYSYQISDEFSIETTNEPGFFNHSCNPNTFLNKDWMFEAIRDIQLSDEILIDYRTMDYSDYGFECTCGNDNCCGVFNGLACNDLDYQKLNYQYFTPYLKGKFPSIT